MHNGTDRAAPSEGMWPLFCHEVGLSYEQEDRVRACQRAVLADSKTWITRHTAVATRNVIESTHTAISGMHEAAKGRENAILSVLTPEQRVKFLGWAARKAEAIRRVAEAKVGASSDGGEYEVSPDRHVAANMYIVDHQLSKVRQRVPPMTGFVHQSRLKKLSRRPSFESLAGQEGGNMESNAKMTRDTSLTSFPSTGSLKRSLDDLMSDDVGSMAMHTSHVGVTPEAAQSAAQGAVASVLRDVMAIVPKTSLHYSQLPHYRPFAPVASTQQPFHPSPLRSASSMQTKPRAAPMPMPQSVPSAALPQFTPIPTSVAAAEAAAPSSDASDDIDIPMPTPVSVLLRTSDEFLSPNEVDDPSPMEVSSSHQGGFIPAPEPASSSFQPSKARAYQSAPQLYNGENDHDYPSLLPSPMAMIPVPEEGSLMNNAEQINDNDEFLLENLPLDADDWAIGEGFEDF